MSPQEKLLRVIQERQLVSFSNNTRWKNFTASKILKLPLQFRIKWIFRDTAASWGRLFSPVDGYLEQGDLGPIPFREIEWLEIDPIQRKSRGILLTNLEIDHSKDIGGILTECQQTFLKRDKIYRVFGYREAGVSSQKGE